MQRDGNSTYLSLQRALLVRRRIELFCFSHRPDLDDDELSEGEWAQLADVARGLSCFYEITQHLEGQATNGHHGAIWEALPAITILMGEMEKGKDEWLPQGTARHPHPMTVAYQNAWEKLRKYYALTDAAHGLYAAAVLLHPSHRKHYFDVHWTKDEAAWKDVMIAHVKEVWTKEYKPISNSPSPVRKQPLSLVQAFLQKTQAPEAGDDEFDAYIYGTRNTFLHADDVIAWAVEGHNVSPSIRQQLLDLLSIPAMSAKLERIFSQTKLTTTPVRNALLPETVEMVELLRYWWANSVISQNKMNGTKRKAYQLEDGVMIESEHEDTNRIREAL